MLRYYAAITEMDAALGRVFEKLKSTGLDEHTCIIFMGDNGWFLGEHGFTSKVLAYENSIRVPCIISGPEVASGISNELVLNIDIENPELVVFEELYNIHEDPEEMNNLIHDAFLNNVLNDLRSRLTTLKKEISDENTL